MKTVKLNNHPLHSAAIVVIALMSCFLISCGESSEVSNADQPFCDTLSFELTRANNMLFTVALNRTDSLKLMFHTASSGVTMVEAATKVFSSVRFAEDTVSAESWGAGGSSRYSLNNKLQIGETYHDSITIFENKLSGEGSAGKFGPDFFGGHILDFDFEAKRLVVSEQLPNKVVDYKRMPIKIVDDFIFLVGELQIDSTYIQRNYLLHSGYSGSLLLDDEFVSEYNLADKLDIIKENELKDAYGNVIKTKEALSPQVRIGPYLLEDVPTSFFEGAIGRQKMSIMGSGLMRQFNFILDRENKMIYLKIIE